MKHSYSGFSKSLTTLKKIALAFIAVVVLGLSSTLFLGGCSRFPESSGQRFYQLPWPTESGDYRLQRIELKTFSNPGHLEGSLATILVQPFLSRGGLEGGKPVGRFIETKDSTVIPADFISLQGTVVYAHMEFLHAMDVSLGITGGSPLWPAKIGIESSVVDTDGLIQNNAIYDGNFNALLIVPFNDGGNLPITANAGVLAHEHFHAIFQNSVLSKITLSKRKPGKDKKNRDGVVDGTGAEISGEMSVENSDKISDEISDGLIDEPNDELSAHSVRACAMVRSGDGFSTQIDAEDDILESAQVREAKRSKAIPAGDGKTGREVTPEEYNAFLLRGFNEGLADFWAWAYTGDTNFIRHSLPKHTQLRTLDSEPEVIWSANMIKDIVVSGEGKELAGVAYKFGTQYGRFLRHLAKAQVAGAETRQSRLAMARVLSDVLPAFGQLVGEKFDKEFLDPAVLVQPLLAQLNQKNGQMNSETQLLYDRFMGVTGVNPESVPGSRDSRRGSR